MFKVHKKHKPWIIETVYAADYSAGMFLIAQPWGEFEWVPIDEYYLHEEDDKNATKE